MATGFDGLASHGICAPRRSADKDRVGPIPETGFVRVIHADGWHLGGKHLTLLPNGITSPEIRHSQAVEYAGMSLADTSATGDQHAKLVPRLYHADIPPSTGRLTPVTYEEASEARKTAAPLISFPSCPMRPIGTR